MTISKAETAHRARATREALEVLSDSYHITRGTEIRGVVMSVARSGMSRRIRFFVADEGKVWDVTGYVARAIGEHGENAVNDDGLRVDGCGMDMVFHTVYRLSSVMFKGEDRAGYVLRYR